MIATGLPKDAIRSSEYRTLEDPLLANGDANSDRKFATSLIHPAETFPLVLAMGIVIQALAFAGIQGTGLQSLTTKDCGVIGQFMLPGMHPNLFARYKPNVIR